MEADPQPGQRVFLYERVMVRRVGGIDKGLRREHQNETSSSEPETRTVPACLTTSAVHAPEHRSSRKKDVVQRSACSPSPRPIVKAIFSPLGSILLFFLLFFSRCIELNFNRLFYVFVLLTRVAFGNREFVSHILYTCIYTNCLLAPKCIPFV